MKTVIFTFGRFAPPTKAHIKLFQKIITLSKESKSDYKIFLSQTYNRKTDPLKWKFKRQIIKSCILKIHISKDLRIKTPFNALEELSKQGYKKVIMIVGSDRVEEFETRMNIYATKWGIEEFEVRTFGKRDSSAKGIAGISSSKLRQFVVDNDKKKFFNDLPDQLDKKWKRKIFKKCKKNLI